MTDHNARQGGITEALHYLQMGIANLELGNGVHMIDFRNAERAILAAHSANARNGEAVAMQVLREIIAHDDAWEKETQTSRVSTTRADEYLAEFMALKDKARALLAAPAAPAPKLTPHTQDVEQMLDCDEAAPVPAAQAGYHVRRSIAMRIAEYFGRSDMNSIEDVEQIIAAMTIQYTPTPSDAAQADDGQCDGCGADLGDAYCAGCLVDAVPKWLQSIKDDGYRTDNERCAAEILLKLAAEPRQQSATPAEPVINESALTAAVWQRICELPDRNSPEGEPDACVLTLREFSGCMANALEDLNLLPPQGIATPPECTCPSGNGSLRHPCPVHSLDAASEAIYLAKLRNGMTTWLEFTAEAWAKLDSTWIRCKADAASEADKRDLYPQRLLHESDASLAERVDSWHERRVQRERQQGADRG